jgi:hypothetical protein
MTQKTLHVKNGFIVAISLEGETIQPYGALVQVDYDEPYGVGDTYPRGSEPAPAPVRDLNATKPSGKVPKAIGSGAKKTE